MKSLKQDLVGFHWSAFFEPRLPFTRVPVKLPLPQLHTLFSLSLSLSVCLPPPLLPLSSPAPTLQCTYCQLAMVTPNSSTSFSPPLTPPSPDLCIPLHLSPCRLDCCATPNPSHAPLLLHACILTHPPKTLITKSIPLSICKTLRGPFYFPIFPSGGRGTIIWRDFYTLYPFLFCCP